MAFSKLSLQGSSSFQPLDLNATPPAATSAAPSGIPGASIPSNQPGNISATTYIKNAIVSQFQSGIQQIQQPFIDKAAAGGQGVGQGKALSGALSVGSGLVTAGTSLLAPIFKPISDAANLIGKKLSDIPAVQEFAATPASDTARNAADIISKISNIALAIGGAMSGLRSPVDVAEAPKVIPEPEVPIKPVEIPTPVAEATSVPQGEATFTPIEPVKTVSRTTQTLKPIEGTGDLKTRSLSEGVEANAIEKKLADNFGDLPEYRQLNLADQAQKAANLITSDPVLARAIALGEKAPPKGLLPESVFVAAEHDATTRGDVQGLRDLANSKLAASATTMGQRIRTLGERDSSSPLAAIQDVQKARTEAQIARGETPEKTIETIKTSIRKRNTKETWNSFIKSITC